MSIIVEPIAPDGSIRMHPIGKAISPVKGQQTGGFLGVESRIHLLPEMECYLRGLEQYSHIIVLYWMHEQNSPQATTQPQGHQSAPEVGMFACR